MCAKRISKHRRNGKSTYNGSSTNEWGELDQVSIHVANTINSLSHQTRNIISIVKNERFKEEVLGEEAYGKIVRGTEVLSTDLLAVANEFASVREKHQNRSGGVRNEDQVMEVLSLGIAYDDITKKVTALALDATGDIYAELMSHMERPEVQPILAEINAVRKSCNTENNVEGEGV